MMLAHKEEQRFCETCGHWLPVIDALVQPTECGDCLHEGDSLRPNNWHNWAKNHRSGGWAVQDYHYHGTYRGMDT